MDSAVGFKISVLQAEHNVSNIELAKRMGIRPQNVPVLRRAKRHRLTTIHKLSKAFRVPVEYFLDS